MPSEQGQEKTGTLERGLLLAALGFYALALPLCGALFRPGFAAYDEESFLDQIQAWREGHPLLVRFGWSSLYRALGAALVACGGPHLFLLRLPAEIAVVAEAILLYAWLKGRLGERAALWAALADLVCTATFARGASLLGCSILPASFLLAVIACEGLRRPAQAFLWGLAVSLMLLDYEGWAGALLFLAPYGFWLWRGKKALRTAGILGLSAGACAVVALSPDLLSHVHARQSLSSPDAGFAGQIWANLCGLFSWGDRLPFSAAPKHPWPAPWTWPLLALGALPAFRRFPWLAWLLVSGGLALGLADTDHEPHRLCLALLALGACAGAGAARLWPHRWGRILCLALLVYGSADEISAWTQAPAGQLALAYGPSVDLEASALWLARNQPPGGWDVISGLGSRNDGAFRFLLDQDGVRPGGTTPVALIAWDYRPGLKTLDPSTRGFGIGSAAPVFLALPGARDAQRLRAVRDSLAALRWTQISESLGIQAQSSARWLQAPENVDPWARTVAWEQWLFASLLRRSVDLGGVHQLLAEPLVCGWAPEVLAKELAQKDPVLAERFSEKAQSIDPRRVDLGVAARNARY